MELLINFFPLFRKSERLIGNFSPKGELWNCGVEGEWWIRAKVLSIAVEGNGFIKINNGVVEWVKKPKPIEGEAEKSG